MFCLQLILPHFLGFPFSCPLRIQFLAKAICLRQKQRSQTSGLSQPSVSALSYSGLAGCSFPPCMVLGNTAAIVPWRMCFCPERELAIGICSSQGNRGTSMSLRRIQPAQGSGRLCTPPLLSPGGFWWIQPPVRECSNVSLSSRVTVSVDLGSAPPGLLSLRLLKEGKNVVPAPFKGITFLHSLVSLHSLILGGRLDC